MRIPQFTKYNEHVFSKRFEKMIGKTVKTVKFGLRENDDDLHHTWAGSSSDSVPAHPLGR